MKIGPNKIFIDTNIFIYFVNRVSEYYESINSILEREYNNGSYFYTSTITKTEFYLRPLRENDRRTIVCFNEMLKDLQFEVNNIDSSIAVEAAYIRTKYSQLKLADSLQIASAIVNGCDKFLTNDKRLNKIAGIEFINPL